MVLRSLISGLTLLTPSTLLAQVDDDAIVITGVVDAVGGGGGSKAKGEENWTSSFHLVAWRIDGSEEIKQRELRVEIPDQSEQSLSKWASVFPSRTLVRFAIRAPVMPGQYRDLAVLRAPLPTKPDPQIEAIAHAILNPPPYTDPIFGVFMPTETFPNVLERKHDWLGQNVTLSLSLDADGPKAPESARECSQHLLRLWENRESWDVRIRAKIADDYYDVWLDGWREEGEAIITREEFAARFVLEAVDVSPSGFSSMIFGDDDLFWGHGMSVTYVPESDTLDVSLFG